MSRVPRRVSIRFRITLITVTVTLILSIAFGCISYFFFRDYARASVLLAAEFNLQQAAHTMQQDLIELNSLAGQEALDAGLVEYLTAESPTGRQALDVFDEMTLKANSSRSYQYLHRFLATDGKSRIIQVSGTITQSVPLNQYNLAELPKIGSGEESAWEYTFHDPFFAESAPDSLLTMHLVYRPRTTEVIGVVYLSASAQLIADRLSSYDLIDGGMLLLETSKGTYLLNGSQLTEDAPEFESVRQDRTAPRAEGTLIRQIVTQDGASYAAVSCRVGNFGLTLTHLIPASELFAQQTLLWYLIGGTVLFVLSMGLFLFLYLNRLIVRPVSALRARIAAIAGGDFSNDPAIEWDSELGDVGRGVNRLSHDVQALMAKQIDDLKERQNLEYKMLQNQMNPHFIYNTLNSIKWMATIQGAPGIAEMTTSFARLLKSVSKGNRPLITLREEFALLNDYCTIQQYRYGGAITIEIAEISNERLCECLIPSFSLQPLAENAIFHGIEPKGGVGSIWLRIRQDETGDVHIAMQDDGVGMTQEEIDDVFRGAGKEKEYRQIGVFNVNRRIQYAFGPQYGLSIQSEPGKYTRVEIKIPFRPNELPSESKESEGAK